MSKYSDIMALQDALDSSGPSDHCFKCGWKGVSPHDSCPNCGGHLHKIRRHIPETEENHGDTVVGRTRFDAITGTII